MNQNSFSQRRRRGAQSDPGREAPYETIADLLLASRKTVALTGAGMSTRSGIPDFRSPGTGVWAYVDPLEVASVWGFRAEPQRFYDWIRPLARKVYRARPNPAHHSLAWLEHAGLLHGIVTQNIDELHQMAGSTGVVHVHGTTAGATCQGCGRREEAATFWPRVVGGQEVPLCLHCGDTMKPDVVLYGEQLPPEMLARAQQAALACDLMLVAGTSLEVMPAADLPLLARRRGARLVVLNLGHTLADHRADVVIQEDVTVSLPRIVEICRRRLDRPTPEHGGERPPG